MNQEAKLDGWSTVLNSIRTPLGLFALIALIIDTALLGAATLTDRLSMLVPVGVLALLIICIFVVVMLKPHAFYHPRDWPSEPETMTVNLVFPEEPYDINLDVDHCEIDIRDKEGTKKHGGAPNIIFGHGGWTLRLATAIKSSDSVRLSLTEYNGRKWSVKPFVPFEKDVEVSHQS